jgi:hypothetical protein
MDVCINRDSGEEMPQTLQNMYSIMESGDMVSLESSQSSPMRDDEANHTSSPSMADINEIMHSHEYKIDEKSYDALESQTDMFVRTDKGEMSFDTSLDLSGVTESESPEKIFTTTREELIDAKRMLMSSNTLDVLSLSLKDWYVHLGQILNVDIASNPMIKKLAKSIIIDDTEPVIMQPLLENDPSEDIFADNQSSVDSDGNDTDPFDNLSDISVNEDDDDDEASLNLKPSSKKKSASYDMDDDFASKDNNAIKKSKVPKVHKKKLDRDELGALAAEAVVQQEVDVSYSYFYR